MEEHRPVTTNDILVASRLMRQCLHPNFDIERYRQFDLP